MRIAAGLIAVCILLSGCGGQIPRKEWNEVDAATYTKGNQVSIRHFVKEDDLFVECIIPSVSFSGSKHARQAKIKVYVDGAYEGEYNTAAFVVKGLEKGVHTVKLEVVDKTTDADLGIRRQFYITVT
ncbi:hypothetical protein BpJC7_23350 [Weizmannia acidilactici]|uniref:Lipoprotein n=1 Tax=Weizmannia acidilactici TaxID=2607726 RepID=A0A5J4J814_9BACI|nr:hypothetical protein [Weizmannia acidilactici]GER68185.1 hypothetical protein BpJC4_26560 [Weizmannia acidilactici]GER71032.1 hypothetical protein BpJC7_23350 [Weizmannia acidilactici]GER74473.1 hypothetical protein BpPP18_25400 [Weizmannia acidilactici]